MFARSSPMRANAYRGATARHWAEQLRSGALLASAPEPLPATAVTCAEQLARRRPQCRKETVFSSMLETSLRSGFRELGATAGDAELLTEAVHRPLAEALAVLAVERGVLRLEIVHQQSCPKWHVDRLRWRVCCALAGAGTEYLPPGQEPGEPFSANVRRLPTGLLAAMAGSLAGAGLWHRSPHACAAHPRLYLSMDVG